MGYRGKVDQQARARELRAVGWTLTEICSELEVSKASASLWCRDVEIDLEALAQRRRARYLRGNEGARQRGPNALQRRKQAEIDEARAAGAEAIGHLTPRELMLVGTMLYAGEGSKTDGCVSLPNSDPRIIRFFLTWLRTCFDIEERRLRGRLYLHEGLDLDAAVLHWVAVTAIPSEQFTRPYRAAADPSIRRSKHPMGCLTVSYACSRTHREVMGLMTALLTCEVPSGVAQLAEHAPVKRVVVGSSPTPGA
jgi:hypothetical protein